LAARNVWQGSSLLMYCAQSTNAGATWTTANLGANRAWGDPDLALATNAAMLAAIRITTTTCAPGGSKTAAGPRRTWRGRWKAAARCC
jgi:hypothetical protein